MRIRSIAASLLASLLFTLAAPVAADSTAQALPFSQNWSNTGLITANDNWSGVPGVEGFLGQDIVSTTGANPQTLTGTSALANDLDVIANQLNPNTNSSGGATEFDGIANPVVALQGSGTADAPYLLIHLDTRGRSGVTVAYTLRDVDGSTDNAVQPVALQFRVGNSGAFTNVPAGFVADASSGPSLATLETAVSAVLPPGADDQALVQVRIITANAVGNDEWIGVDDISITAGTTTPALSINDVSVTEGNSGTTTATFTVSLSAPAGAGGVGFDVASADGSATVADNDYVAVSLTGQAIAAGASSASVSVTVNGDTAVEANETFFLNVSNVSGATVADAQGLGTISNDDAAASPDLTISDVSVFEGNAGTSNARFTVSLATPAPAGGVSFEIATADGTATAGSDYAARALTAQTIAAGVSSADFDVVINGDSNFEADETFTVAVSNVTGATVVDGSATGTIRNDDVALVAIHAVQGAGSQSPRVGEDLNVEGIVTARKSNGFFVQTPDGEADADPSTSQALFVFTSTAPTVASGDRVRVFGRVTEFAFSDTVVRQLPLTQLASATGVTLAVTVISSGNPLPTPVDLAAADLAPGNGREAMERFEAMRVRAPSLVTVAPTNANISEPNATSTPGNGVFFATLAGVPRPLREPGLDPDEIVSTTAPGSIPRFDNNTELLRIDSDGQTGAARVSVDAGTSIANLVGVIDYAFAYYSLLPDAGQLAADTVTGIPNLGRTPTAVAAAGAEEITIGGFNLLRFFDSVNDPGTSEPVLTAAALDKRLGHTAEAICSYVQLPDVLGVVEVENLAVLTQLADRINAFGAAGSNGCARNPQYVAYLVEGNDVGGIDVGYLVSTREVRPGVPRVAVAEATQFGRTTLFTNPDASTELLNDRPPLLLRATFNHADGGSEPLSILINHMRSLGGVSDTAAGSNGWATSGDRVRAKRGAQAQYLAQLVHDRQVADPQERIVLLGDFNVFEFNDGLVDGMGILTGRPAAAGQALLVLPSPLATPLTVMTPLSPRSEQYSFSFDGNAQSLDHAVVNQRVLDRLRGVRTEHARINSDFAETRFGNGPLRTSDHDPVVIYMRVPAFRSVDLGVDAAAVAATIAPGGEAQFTIDVASAGANASDGASLRLVLDRALPGTTATAPSGWTCGAAVVGASSTEITCSASSVAAASSARFTLRSPTGSGIGAVTLGLAATITGSNADGVAGNNSDSASVSVVVANRAPVANDDGYGIVAGSVLDVAAPGVLGNDSDADGDALDAQLITGPTSGSATVAPNGALRYQPNPGFAGSDSLVYRACDAAPACATATVRIVVSAAPAAFATRDDRFVVAENSPELRLDVAANDVIDIARRAPGRLTVQQSPLVGTAVLDDGGTPGDASDDRIRYRPNADRSGADLFSYQLCEGGLGSRCSEGLVQVVVRPLVDAQTRLEIAGNGGFRDLSVEGYRAMADARIAATPLLAPRVDELALGADPDAEDPWDPRGRQVVTGLLASGSEWRVLIDARSLSGGDVDLYVGLDLDGDGQPSRSELRCTSAMSATAERCELAATPVGTAPAAYWVMAHNPGTSAHTARIERFEVPLRAGDATLMATGPASAGRLAAWPLRLGWSDSSLLDGESRAGYVALRESEGAAPTWMPVRLDRRGGSAAAVALSSARSQSLRLAPGERQARLFIDVPPGQRSLVLTLDTDRALELAVVRSPAVAPVAAPPLVPAANEADALVSFDLLPGQRRVSFNAPAAGRWSFVLANPAMQPAAVRVEATLAGTAPLVRPGSYYNSARGGHGLFLYPAGSTWSGVWFTYRQDGTPTWYFLQEAAPGSNGVWRSGIYRSAWNGSRNTLTEVGSALLTPSGPDAFTFTHTMDGETGSEAMTAFGRGCPALAGAPVDASGLWFNPARAGSGYAVQLFPGSEFHAVFGYDASGVARFAVAERRGFGGADATLDLEQIQGFCPLCVRAGEPLRTRIGSFRRGLGAGGLASVVLDANWVNGVPGRWAANEAVQALGGTQGCATP
jgi:predicted extracellular nuclease